MANQRLNIDIVARDKSRQALTGVQKSLARLKGSVFNLRTAFLGLGAGLVIRNLINTGKELENLQVRLKFLLKDTNEGAKAFENMVKFASKVPFTLEEIQSGSGILATITDNAKDLTNMLEITGNVAAVTGLDFRTTAEQIQRSMSAGIGAADLFREKGVRNMLGFQAGATVSIEETAKAFEKVFGKGGRFGNATDQLAQTFGGTMSMLGDKVLQFKFALLDAGFFSELKNQFGNLNIFLEKNSKQLERMAIAIGKNLAQGMVKVVQIGKDLIPTLQKIGRILKSIADGFLALPPFVQEMGVVGAFLFGKKGLAALVGISLFMDKIKEFQKRSEVAKGIFDVKNLEDVSIKIDLISKKISDLETQSLMLGGVPNPALDKELKNLRAELEMYEQIEKKLTTLNNIRKLGEFEHQKELHKGLKTHEQINKEFEKKMENTARENGLLANQNQQIETIMSKLKILNKTSLADVESKFDNIKGTIAQGINNGITMMSEKLARAFVFGEKLSDTFKNMARSLLVNVLSALIEIVARKGVELAIEKMITKEKQKQAALSGVSGGGSLFSMAKSFLGFAKGGAVSKGQPVITGENGPEVFLPNSTGQITQAARGTGGGQTTVNFNINTLDASGFDDLLVRNRGTITQIINNAVNERGSRNLI
jgi:hypothetical protein